MKKSAIKVKTGRIYLYILPFIIMFAVAYIIPLCVAIGISFTNWRGGKNIKFIGIDNYMKLFQDQGFWISFLNNLKFMVLMLIFQLGFAFLFALFVQSKRVKLKGFHRRAIFLPSVLSSFVVALIWQIVYNKNFGLISAVAEKIGLEDKVPLWLDDPKIVINSLAIVLIWQFVGQYVIILMAGLQNVDQSLMEAAMMDGANTFQSTLHITLPLMKPTLIVCITLCISGCMKLFDTIYALTGGGPGSSSMVTAMYAYNQAFKLKQFGYASAVSIGMIILSLILVLASRKILNRKEEV